MIYAIGQSNRLKVSKDECGDASICGKHGHIYEHGAGRLGVCIISKSGNAYRWNRARAAFAAAGMDITQNGDQEGCATFDPENATQAKTAMLHAKIRARKQLSAEHREAVLARLAIARQVRLGDFPCPKHWQNGVDIELET